MNKVLTIYTDGSHFKGKTASGRLGIGGVIISDGKVINKFSKEISKDYLLDNFGTSDCSNPTMEMLAVLEALETFKSELRGCNNVTIKADYLGVTEWNLGRWKIKMPYIQKIKNAIDAQIQHQGLKGKVNFEWVRGHQKGISDDVKWNNLVDSLARGEE